MVYHQFLRPFTTVFVRLYPKSWYSWVSMRVELFGCTGKGYLCLLDELFFYARTCFETQIAQAKATYFAVAFRSSELFDENCSVVLLHGFK